MLVYTNRYVQVILSKLNILSKLIWNLMFIFFFLRKSFEKLQACRTLIQHFYK